MAPRLRDGLPVLLAGLLLQTGCVTTSLFDSDHSITSHGDEPAVKAPQTLPPKQSAELHLNLADKFEKTGNLGEAAAQLEMARHENPTLKDIDHRLAILYDELGKQQKALEELEKKLAARPKDPDLLNDVGWFHYDCGNWTEAEKHFRQAVAANPQYQRAWINLGLTLGQQERYPESMDAFRKVVRPAEAECNLAFVYLTQGKRAEARAAYVRALKHEPASQLARAALARLDETGDAPEVSRSPVRPSR